jgi:hypothetical protein
MNAQVISRLLWLRRKLRGHDRWTRLQLEAHQARALHELRDDALGKSPLVASQP